MQAAQLEQDKQAKAGTSALNIFRSVSCMWYHEEWICAGGAAGAGQAGEVAGAAAGAGEGADERAAVEGGYRAGQRGRRARAAQARHRVLPPGVARGLLTAQKLPFPCQPASYAAYT